ncbi:MAG: hypothetical protein K2F64_00365 [Muribaculaceae bacterium]|nr:hypothetical protein [Muribaculaceae bacterium]
MFDPEFDSDKEDFFNSPVPEEKPKEPKRPEPKPDDPNYWEQDESRWEHLRLRRRSRFYLWLCIAGVGIGLLITGWLRWFSPAVEDATAYGFVEKIQKEGLFFKTYEGTILPYREIMDTTRVYRSDFLFTAADDKIAAALKQMEGSGLPVRVEYKTYRASLPWRGSNVNIITKVDTARAERLLPPEFAPDYVPDRPYHRALREVPDSAKIVAGSVSEALPERNPEHSNVDRQRPAAKESAPKPQANTQPKKAEASAARPDELPLFH